VQLNEAASFGAFRRTAIQVETGARRSFVTPQGAPGILKPDLMVTISSADYDDHWYMEIDLGTESLPVLLRECRMYEEYRPTGRAQAEHEVFPRRPLVLPDTARVARLQDALADDPRLPGRLFACIITEDLIDTLGTHCGPGRSVIHSRPGRVLFDSQNRRERQYSDSACRNV
jgi:hypothetical protein